MRGLACLGSLLSAFASTSSSFSLLLRSSLHVDLLLLLCGPCCSALLLSIPGGVEVSATLPAHDLACFEPFVFLQGFSCSGSLLSVLGSTGLELFLFLRGCCRLALNLFVLGVAHIDLPLPLRGITCIGPVLLASEIVQPASLLSLQSNSRADHQLSLLSCAMLGPFLLVQSAARSGLVVPMSDFISIELFVSVQCSSQLNEAFVGGSGGRGLPVLDIANLDSLLLLRSPACFDFFLSIGGRAAAESLLFADGEKLVGSFTFARSTIRAGFLLLALGVSRLGFVLLVVDSVSPESSLSLHGASCLGLVLLAISCIDLESLPFLRGASHLGFALSAMDAMSLESTLPARSFTQIGLMLSVMAIEMGAALSVGTEAIFGFFMSLQGVAQLGPALPLLNLAQCGSSLLPRSIVRSGFSLSLFGGCQLGSSPLAVAVSNLGSLLLLRGLS